MKKIKNPWVHKDGYFCFGCAPNNPIGVKMEFYEDGDDIVSIWSPSKYYQGWVNTLHGGIASTLLDEVCGWVVSRKLQTTGVTSIYSEPSEGAASPAAIPLLFSSIVI